MRERVALYGIAAVVCVVVLGPLVVPGYVLAYDMVFVPRQPLRWDLVAPADALPRAVPLDVVVSLVTQVVPGWLLQRFVLVAVLTVAAVGAGRLVPADRLLTRLVAAVGYAWTPYVAERLLIGHWALLLGYATLPWLVAAAIGLRAGRPGSLARLVLAAAPAALTPTGGLMAFVVVAVLVPGRVAAVRPASLRPTTVLAIAAVAALNAPWLAAAAITTAGGRSDPFGVTAFAARAENWSGAFGALAGTGGIWNAQTTPASRQSALTPLVTAVLLAFAVSGFMVLRRRWAGDGSPLAAGPAVRLAALALGGFAVAAAGAVPVVADGLAWLVSNVPGGGLLRDGQKFLAPYALLLVLSAALGVERLAARMPANAPAAGRSLLIGLMLLPVVAMPDLALAGAGRLRPVQYGADWEVVAGRVGERPGTVLSLPLAAYRVYHWNPGSVVIDPLPRYLPAEVITDDRLLVGDSVVEGENARVADIRRLMASGRSVAETGVRWVVVQRDAGKPVDAASLAGLRFVYSGPTLTLYENPEAAPERRADRWRRALVTAAGLLALGVLLASLAASGRRTLVRPRTRP
ncbi:hypothetical protein AB0H83_43680 [Dactylosporangium sp. NPDC050688]|uniref:hypothetical protein n=1 Tax=Dactylosporangium sp. NPDC050688 TaxID=3157217 RepID=UPI0033E2736F